MEKSFAFIKSRRTDSLSNIVETIIYSSLGKDDYDTILVVPKANFGTTQRYCWFRVVNNHFFAPTEEEMKWIQMINANQLTQRVAYLHIEINEILRSFSFEAEDTVVVKSSDNERLLSEDLFSALRTSRFDTLLIGGGSGRVLRDLYNKYWGKRYVSYLDAVEILEVERFFQRYGLPLPTLRTAIEIKLADEEHLICPSLTEWANELGLSRHSLLDFGSKDLMDFVGLTGSSDQAHKTLIMRDVYKNATRSAVLSAMAEIWLLNVRPDLFERYRLCSSLPQECCIQALRLSPLEVRKKYANLLRRLGDFYELGEYVYSKKENEYFQPLDRIVCLVDISRQRRIAESSKYEGHYSSRLIFELNEDGVLNSNVVLSEEQKERLKRLLSQERTNTLERIYDLLQG